MGSFELNQLALGVKCSKTIELLYAAGNSFMKEDDVNLVNLFTTKSHIKHISLGKYFYLSHDAFQVNFHSNIS